MKIALLTDGVHPYVIGDAETLILSSEIFCNK